MVSNLATETVPRLRFNKYIPPYQWFKSLIVDVVVIVSSSYIPNGISYTGKIAPSYKTKPYRLVNVLDYGRSSYVSYVMSYPTGLDHMAPFY